MKVIVNAACIAEGERGSALRGPLSWAIGHWWGVRNGWEQKDGRGYIIPVRRGPARQPIMDVRVVADISLMTTYYAVFQDADAALPWRAQWFQQVWEYGPKSGPFKVTSEDGQKVWRLDYGQIVLPFEFDLDVCPTALAEVRA